MSSAPVGTRMVARALPGSGGSAARARASAACLAAWRAAQGAAPRRPSLRLAGAPLPSSLMTASEGRVTEASAADRLTLAWVWGAFALAFFAAPCFEVPLFVVLVGFFDMAQGPR